MMLKMFRSMIEGDPVQVYPQREHVPLVKQIGQDLVHSYNTYFKRKIELEQEIRNKQKELADTSRILEAIQAAQHVMNMGTVLGDEKEIIDNHALPQIADGVTV